MTSRINLSSLTLFPMIDDSIGGRIYQFDEFHFSTTTVLDSLTGSNSLTPMNASTPSVVSSPFGNANEYSGGDASESQTMASAKTAFEAATATFSVWCKINALPAASQRGTIVGYWGDNSLLTAVESGLFLAAVDEDGVLELIWEDNGSTISWQTTEVTLRLDEWYQLDFVMIPNASNCDVEIYVDGYLRDTLENLTRPAGGDNSHLVVGGINNGGSNVLPLSGDIAFVSLVGSSLTAKQIRRNYQLSTGTLTPKNAPTMVEIKDQNDGWRNLEDYFGQNSFVSFSMDGSEDQNTQSAVIQIAHAGGKTFSALRTKSVINLDDRLDASSFDQLLIKSREIRAYTYDMPLGFNRDEYSQAAKRQHIIFDGEILSSQSADEITTVNAVDFSFRLAQSLIEGRREYGAEYRNEDGGYVTGSSVLLEEVMQDILDDNDSGTLYGAYPSTTLTTPESPGFAITQYTQDEDPVWSALTTLAQLIGWDVRYRYSPANDDIRLTLQDPAPTVTRNGPIFDLARSISRTPIDIKEEDIVNVCTVYYQSTEDYALGTPPDINTIFTFPSGWVASNVNSGRDSTAERTPAKVTVENRNSIDKYGLRVPMKLAENATSPISECEEAGKLAIKAVETLSDPKFEISATFPGIIPCEVGQLCPLVDGECADNDLKPLHFDEMQEAYIIERSYADSSDGPTTTVRLRGSPANGRDRLLRLAARPGMADTPIGNGFDLSTSAPMNERIRNIRTAVDSGLISNAARRSLVNSDFSRFSRGDRYEPDGWIDRAGSWLNATSTLACEPVVGASSGNLAIQFGTATSPTLLTGGERRGIQSSLIPVDEGDIGVSFVIDSRWTFTSGSGQGLDFVVEWVDEDRSTVLSSDTVTMSRASSASGNWITTRSDALTPNASARFARVCVGAESGNSAVVTVDRVNFVPVRPKVLALTKANVDPWFSGAPAYTVTKAKNFLVPFNTVDSADGGFNDGGMYSTYYSGTTTVGADPGTDPSWEIEIPQDGIYKVSFSLYFNMAAAVTANEPFITIEDGGTFDVPGYSSDNKCELVSGGTEIYRQMGVSNDGVLFHVHGTFQRWFDYGQSLTMVLNNPSSQDATIAAETSHTLSVELVND